MSATVQHSAKPALTVTPFGTDWFGDLAVRLDLELDQKIENCRATPVRVPEQNLLAEATLRKTEYELRTLSAAMMTMQEIERKRIASDLHDSIGQSLSALSCGIAAALEGTRKGNSIAAGMLLEKLASQVKEAIIEVQRIAMDLRPAMLDDIGLVATLTWFLREFQCLHPGLQLKIDIDDAIEECVALPTLRTNIFRVIQEALSNIVKHACASEIHIRLRRVDREIHLEVTDNGVGFVARDRKSTVPSSSGMGLKSMRERAEYSGGRFCLISLPGKGSRVFIRWPLAA